MPVPPGGVVLTDLVLLTYYTGDFPIAPLVDGAHDGLDVRVVVHLWAPETGTAVSVSAAGSWLLGGGDNATTAKLSSGDNGVRLTLRAELKDVKLWWPLGSGEGRGLQLYAVSATVHPAGAPYVAANCSIGFRTVALVTGNDTAPGYVAAAAFEEALRRARLDASR